MTLVLNIIGIGFIIYGLIFITKNSREVPFSPEEFLEELDSFGDLLDIKSDENLKEEPKLKIRDSSNKYNQEQASKTKKLIRDVSELNRTGVLNSKNREVLHMRDLGFSNEEIAREMGRSIREIEVILKINNKS